MTHRDKWEENGRRRRNCIHAGIPLWPHVLLVTVLLSIAPSNLANASAAQPRALILYDGPSSGYSEGLISANSIANLLGHFSASYDIQPVSDYQSGRVEKLRLDLLCGQHGENTVAQVFS